jgi:hypothetical protein
MQHQFQYPKVTPVQGLQPVAKPQDPPPPATASAAGQAPKAG